MTETETSRDINKDSGIKGFSIERMSIFISDGKIHLKCNGDLYEFSVEEFSRRPRGVMERIIDIGRGAN